MKIQANTIQEYLDQLPEDRRQVMMQLRETILAHLPHGFEEKIQYDMITYVVPRSKYPKGYHCNPEDDLAFLSIGNQKKHLAIYHMGIYMIPEVYQWFVDEYPNYMKTKLNMGKSCIRFTNMKTVPYELIGQLCEKIDVDTYVKAYEAILNKE